MDLKAGQFVTCCCGSRAVIIAVEEHRIMLMRIGKFHNTYIVGHDPIVYNGEVQWTWGHYFDCFNGNDDGMLLAAAQTYKELTKTA